MDIGLFNRIRRNTIRLDSCKQHAFEVDKDSGYGEKLTCLNCGGEMLPLAINRYIRGFSAAGGDPNKIWKGWSNGPGITVRCPVCFCEDPECDFCEGRPIHESKARGYFESNP